MTLYKNYAKFENNNLNIVLTILFIMHSNQIKKTTEKKTIEKDKASRPKRLGLCFRPNKKKA
jgi:hypothetical protein